MMKWYNIDQSRGGRVNYSVHGTVQIPSKLVDDDDEHHQQIPTFTCPSCGHILQLLHHHHKSSAILEDLPAGVKFDPTDQEILQHLEAKELMSNATGAAAATRKQLVHPLIDEFIPTIDGENGICYTHPEKLPGVSKDGQIRHFFHRPSKAYTTGNRKRRKVHNDDHNNGGETRWHKTGKTRPITTKTGGGGGRTSVKGYKKILVLYTNYGRQRKPEKTNWVMHQYHLGEDEEEKDGELVVSKVFYQTQPRQLVHGRKIINAAPARSNLTLSPPPPHYGNVMMIKNIINPSFMDDQYNYGSQNRDSKTAADDHDGLILPNMIVHGDHDGSSSFIHQLPSGVSKDKL